MWLAALELCRSYIAKACETAWGQDSTDGEVVRVGKGAFSACPSDSIEYAVMERPASRNGATAPGLPVGVVIPLAAGWSDVGGIEALWKVLPKDDVVAIRWPCRKGG